MDIFNNDVRKVVCVNNDDSDCLGIKGDGHLLIVGEEYTVIGVDVHSWHTGITLLEFPGVEFNSVLFEEIEED